MSDISLKRPLHEGCANGWNGVVAECRLSRFLDQKRTVGTRPRRAMENHFLDQTSVRSPTAILGWVANCLVLEGIGTKADTAELAKSRLFAEDQA